jgi:Bestrophin, RFP-TM, chloride channel
MSALLQGNDERGKLMRRTIVRYMVLGYIHAFRDLNDAVMRRFPELNDEEYQGKPHLYGNFQIVDSWYAGK